MSISSLRTGAIGISAALDNNYMEPIASTLVGAGGVNTVIFNDIPQTYKHLQIRYTARDERTGGAYNSPVWGYFNGDYSANYYRHNLLGTGSSASAEASANNFISIMSTADYTSGIFGAGIIDILDYTNPNKNKVSRSLSGMDGNGAGYVFLFSMLWMNTTPITSIKLSSFVGNFQQHSRFSLYGIKG
jgi:hypothetical protein